MQGFLEFLRTAAFGTMLLAMQAVFYWFFIDREPNIIIVIYLKVKIDLQSSLRFASTHIETIDSPK